MGKIIDFGTKETKESSEESQEERVERVCTLENLLVCPECGHPAWVYVTDEQETLCLCPVHCLHIGDL